MQENAGSLIIQVVLGAGVLAVVYYIALATAMQDSLVQVSAPPASMVTVAAGVIPNDTSFIGDSRLNMTGRHEVDLPRSMNLKGGAEFSYSFWIKLPDYTLGDFKGVVLYRGDKTTAPFVDPVSGVSLKLPLAFCPMVIVARSGTTTTVSCHVNTMAEKNFSATVQSEAGDVVNWTKWNLITVACADAFPFDSPTAGATSCSVWVNQVETRVMADVSLGSLRENSGELHLLPSDAFGDVACFGSAPVSMRDVAYANHAMSSAEIYAKIAKEAGSPAVPYKRSQVDSPQAFWDISMKHVSV